jgi:hypothetical protein
LPLKELDEFAAAQLTDQLHLSAAVSAVKLKDQLRGVQADHADGHGGRLPVQVSTTAPWHIDAVGAVHPICL